MKAYRLEYSEIQRCFHQESYPLTSGYNPEWEVLSEGISYRDADLFKKLMERKYPGLFNNNSEMPVPTFEQMQLEFQTFQEDMELYNSMEP